MGKKLDALLGRGFKTSRFKATVNLAISRLSVLRNQHQARCSLARSDVLQILNLAHHERALLRVEQVIKEQNLMDVFVMIENYCFMLIERVNLLEHAKECPEELKEAIASLIYAATRCGEFPELQELRAVFTSCFGKEFIARAVQLRNNCGVHPKMIQKLSTRMPSMENRLKVLKEIALENDIFLKIEEEHSVHTEVKLEVEKKGDPPRGNQTNGSKDSLSGDSKPIVPEDVEMIEGFSNSMKMRRKYKDAAEAAQAAFESAAHAAAAARTAVELSRSDSHDSDDGQRQGVHLRMIADSSKHIQSKLQISYTKECKDIDDLAVVRSEKVRPLQNSGSESEDEEMQSAMKLEAFKQKEEEAEKKRSFSASSLDSALNILDETKVFSDEDEMIGPQGKEAVFDSTDDENDNISRVMLPGSHVEDSVQEYTRRATEVSSSEEVHTVKDDVIEESAITTHGSSYEILRSQAEVNAVSRHNNSEAYPAKGYGEEGGVGISKKKAPVSVRTRRTYRW